MSVSMAIGVSNFEWTPWMSHRDCWLGRLPKSAGIYRIRRIGADFLDYVGQTGGGYSHLLKRQGALKFIYNDELMPYADPHTAAPGLWALRQELGCEFEISVLPLTCSDNRRKAIEAFVISDHRHTHGRSPTINFGRMPSGWEKSSGVSSKLKALDRERRGARCTELTQHHEIGIPPVGVLDPAIFDINWCNHYWSAWCPLEHISARKLESANVGLYRIRGENEKLLVYVGQGKVRSRLTSHCKEAYCLKSIKGKAFASGGKLEVSWVLNSYWTKVQIEELENDLIAAHYIGTGEAPIAQFGGMV